MKTAGMATGWAAVGALACAIGTYLPGAWRTAGFQAGKLSMGPSGYQLETVSPFSILLTQWRLFLPALLTAAAVTMTILLLLRARWLWGAAAVLCAAGAAAAYWLLPPVSKEMLGLSSCGNPDSLWNSLFSHIPAFSILYGAGLLMLGISVLTLRRKAA